LDIESKDHNENDVLVENDEEIKSKKQDNKIEILVEDIDKTENTFQKNLDESTINNIIEDEKNKSKRNNKKNKKIKKVTQTTYNNVRQTFPKNVIDYLDRFEKNKLNLVENWKTTRSFRTKVIEILSWIDKNKYNLNKNKINEIIDQLLSTNKKIELVQLVYTIFVLLEHEKYKNK